MKFSDRVRIYSFLLTVLVIWIHAVQPSLVFPEEGLSGSLWLPAQQLLGTYLGQIAVPGFFVISGYLFFRNAGGTGAVEMLDKTGGSAADVRRFFLGKWKSRCRSLLIPYLLWNLIYYLIYLAAGRAELSLQAFLEGLLLYRYNPVFWYLQQLIILTVLSPLVWLLVKTRRTVLPVLILLFLLAVCYASLPFHIVNEDALFYYAAGAAAALHCRAFVEAEVEPLPQREADKESDVKAIRRKKRDKDSRKKEIEERIRKDMEQERKYPLRNLWKRILLWSGALFLILASAGDYGAWYGIHYLRMTGSVGCRISGVVCLYAVLMMAEAGSSPTPEYMEYNFFTYATHYLVIRAVQHLAAMAGQHASVSLMVYLLMPVICIASGVVLAKFLQRRTPRIFGLLTGGRMKKDLDLPEKPGG